VYDADVDPHDMGEPQREQPSSDHYSPPRFTLPRGLSLSLSLSLSLYPHPHMSAAPCPHTAPTHHSHAHPWGKRAATRVCWLVPVANVRE